MFLALEKPWASEEKVAEAPEIDAGAEEEDGTPGKRKKRRGKKGSRAGKEVGLQVIDERIELSAADRKMVWRGPAVSLPERNLDMGSDDGGRSLDQSEINQAVSGGQNALMRCIADARGQAELAAGITIKFLVEGNGGIGKIRVHAPSYLLKNGLYACAGEAVRKMRFPSTGAPTVVTVPLDLSY